MVVVVAAAAAAAAAVAVAAAAAAAVTGLHCGATILLLARFAKLQDSAPICRIR